MPDGQDKDRHGAGDPRPQIRPREAPAEEHAPQPHAQPQQSDDEPQGVREVEEGGAEQVDEGVARPARRPATQPEPHQEHRDAGEKAEKPPVHRVAEEEDPGDHGGLGRPTAPRRGHMERDHRDDAEGDHRQAPGEERRRQVPESDERDVREQVRREPLHAIRIAGMGQRLGQKAGLRELLRKIGDRREGHREKRDRDAEDRRDGQRDPYASSSPQRRSCRSGQSVGPCVTAPPSRQRPRRRRAANHRR